MVYGNTPQSGVCKTCEAGKTCYLWGSITIANVDDGFYSPANVPIQYPCPAGYRCDTTQVLGACNFAAGEFSPEKDMVCHPCLKPYACPFSTLGQNQQINCANVRGYYQDQDG